jgi:hypothetical protein
LSKKRKIIAKSVELLDNDLLGFILLNKGFGVGHNQLTNRAELRLGRSNRDQKGKENGSDEHPVEKST